MSKTLKKVEYYFSSTKIKKDLTIAMLADLHNKCYGDKNQTLLDMIKQSHSDIILLAGDMIVCREKHIFESLKTAETIEKMAEIAPVYYGIGNHEGGIRNGSHNTGDLWKKYMDKLCIHPNIHVLENRYLRLDSFCVNIYGLDLAPDHYKRFIKAELKKETLIKLLGELNDDNYNILLAHHPDYFKEYCEISPDLIVSGHNHGGMIRLPLLGGVISPRLHLFPKYDYGLYKQEKTQMVVTSGAGCHSINLRINNSPEIVFIHIKKSNNNL